MDVFTYRVWLQDSSRNADDANQEFVTSFNVIANNKGSAHQWGDKQAKRVSSKRGGLKFLRSEVAFGSDPELPNVIYGHDASDAEIGW